jgi:outer membrane receptor protein involved in Fe transport
MKKQLFNPMVQAKIFFIFTGLILLCEILPAARVSGTVKDLDKNNLPGVVVIVKETGAATMTGPEGKFAIRAPDHLKNVVLVFKRSGFHPKETRVPVDGQPRDFELLFIPQEYLLQKVTVTAMNRETESIDVPMAESSFSQLEIQEKIPENIIDTLADTPGVHFIGSGGFSVTPTIRGLARRRVLILVDGMRVTSDRRAGTSVTFVPPELAGRIEVVRSSSSVLYGSDAVGGVVNILSRSASDPHNTGARGNSFNLNLNSVNKRINTGVALHQDLGRWRIYSGFQFTRAGDYSSPGGKILSSGYTYYSGLLDLAFKNEKREFFLGYIGGVGKDIGKPDRENNPGSYTVVPSESEHFFRLGLNEKRWVENGSVNFSLFLNPSAYHLEKIDISGETFQHSNTEALNLGMKATLKKSPGGAFSYQLGVEWFSRQNVRMKNIQELGDGIMENEPLTDGVRDDYGVFLTFDYAGIRGLNINGGLRYTFFSVEADVEGTHMEKDTGSTSFFLGVTKKFGSSLSAFCTIGRAFRFPSLSESFYTGLTGRKFVIGNPHLEPESSFNIDTGVKLASGRLAMGVYLFAYTIDHMIERYKNQEGIYTHDNILRGRIMGGELEVQYSPFTDIDFYGHYFYFHGRSDENDEALNDVPAPRLRLGARVFKHRLWMEVNYIHSFAKTDPGPAEIDNSAYNLLDVKGGFYFSANFHVYLKLANILNERYYPNPDPDIPYAQGFSLSAGVHFDF